MMKPRITAAVALALISLALSAGTVRAADNYKVDPVHSSVIFKVGHLDLAPFYGRFHEPTGTVMLDKEDPSKSAFTFEVKVENVDTGNAKRDAHLKTPDFFDAKQFPAITFKSKSVKGMGSDKYEVTGDLTLHGVTKEIKLILTKTGEKETKMGYRTGWTTDVTLKRSDYGMSQMLNMVGDEVQLIIAYEAVRG